MPRHSESLNVFCGNIVPNQVNRVFTWSAIMNGETSERLKTCIIACIVAAADDHIGNEFKPYLNNLSKHFGLLYGVRPMKKWVKSDINVPCFGASSMQKHIQCTKTFAF